MAGQANADDGHGSAADRPGEIPPKGWRDVALRVKDELKTDHASLSAAGVAFFGFLSLIPGLAALVTIYGLLADPEEIRERVEDSLAAAPTEVRDLLTEQLARVAEGSDQALGLGLAFSLVVALWAASSGVMHLVEAINDAYDEDEGRGFVKRRLIALALTLFMIVIAGAVVVAFSVAAALGSSNSLLMWTLRASAWGLAALLFVVVLAVLYRFGPDRDEPKWRWVSWGAAFAVIAWVAASIALQVYVSNFGSYNETYGSLAAIVIALLWIYLCSLAVLVGAELNAELEHQTARDSTKGPDQPIGQRDAEMADTVGKRLSG